MGIRGSREAGTPGGEPRLGVQLCPEPASLLCPTEDLYLGRTTAEDGNARARADNPGARAEWAGHKAPPGLTVRLRLEILDSQKAQPGAEESALRKHPRGGAFLSGCSLTSVTA